MDFIHPSIALQLAGHPLVLWYYNVNPGPMIVCSYLLFLGPKLLNSLHFLIIPLKIGREKVQQSVTFFISFSLLQLVLKPQDFFLVKKDYE